MKKETLNGILKKTIHEALDYIGLPEDPEIVKLKMILGITHKVVIQEPLPPAPFLPLTRTELTT